MASMFYLLKWKSDLNIEDIIINLKENALLPNTMICPSCSDNMVVHRDSSRKDHFRWVCKRCRKRKPIRVNTWASHYRIPFTELYVLVRYYVESAKSSSISKRLCIESEIIEKFYADLDRFIPIYISKLSKILIESGGNAELKSLFERSKGDFRSVSRIFTLSLVFNVILETLQEMY